ncbi:hypothetical protein LI020_23460, partial [[Clostridium] symbiosum]|uniref:hypothetical protein n=1 Tax=Clostridium symbiosum TaxID=1512 RepID=UPI001D07F3B5
AESFSPGFPTGRLWPGTEDAKVVAIPIPGLRPLNCSYSFKGGGIVAATTFPRITEECLLYGIQLINQSFSA